MCASVMACHGKGGRKKKERAERWGYVNDGVSSEVRGVEGYVDDDTEMYDAAQLITIFWTSIGKTCVWVFIKGGSGLDQSM